jgi:CheY-like chemotaxis protein
MMRRGSGPSSSLRILAVDDHPLNRLALARQLSALGYDSRLCSDGALALAALEAAPFDAVLTDCVMPGMDGVALATAIGAHPDPRVRATPVIGVTALAARDEVARCIAAGMVVCLDKPTPLDTLRRALADVCAGGGGFDPGRLDSAALLDGIGCVPVRGACRREFLEAFACALEHDRATLEQHLRGVLPGNALRTWCHTARGTFGLFGQRHVDELLDELERRLDGEPDALRTAVGDVFAMIRHLQHRVASAAGERDAIVVSRQQKGE